MDLLTNSYILSTIIIIRGAIIIDKNRSKLVVKLNNLIEFRGKMIVNELKLFNLIIISVNGQ